MAQNWMIMLQTKLWRLVRLSTNRLESQSTRPGWLRLCLILPAGGWLDVWDGWILPSIRCEARVELSAVNHGEVWHKSLLFAVLQPGASSSTKRQHPPAHSLPTASSLSTLTRSIESTMKVSCPERWSSLIISHQIFTSGRSKRAAFSKCFCEH